MRFDDYWSEDDGVGAAEKQLAADGRHTGEIVDAKTITALYRARDFLSRDSGG